MRQTVRCGMAVCLLLAGAARAEDPAGNARPPDKPEPIPDYLTGPVEPLMLAGEKTRFFRAAGVDNELSAKEFAADQASDASAQPFARRFDSYRALLRYDGDRNGSIDWLEAERYRRDLHERIVAKFDLNGNGRLEDTERQAANRALHHGEGLAVARKEGTGGDVISGEMIHRFDADGDGMLNEAELKAAQKAMRADRRAAMLARYDTDRDGKLSKEERSSMWKERQSPWKQWRDRHFDDDGDGQLSDEEKKTATEFMKQFGEIGKMFQRRNMDFDGDGTISKEERAAAQREWAVVGVRMQLRRRILMDTDSDGQVTANERQAFNERFETGMRTWWEGFSKTYDIDASGRLDATERKQLLQGVRGELTRRMDKHDENKDGRLSAFEAEKMLMEFGKDIGLMNAPN